LYIIVLQNYFYIKSKSKKVKKIFYGGNN